MNNIIDCSATNDIYLTNLKKQCAISKKQIIIDSNFCCESDELCAICLTSMLNCVVKHTPCGHTFHLQCLNKLLKCKHVCKNRCPNCRKFIVKKKITRRIFYSYINNIFDIIDYSGQPINNRIYIDIPIFENSNNEIISVGGNVGGNIGGNIGGNDGGDIGGNDVGDDVRVDDVRVDAVHVGDDDLDDIMDDEYDEYDNYYNNIDNSDNNFEDNENFVNSLMNNIIYTALSYLSDTHNLDFSGQLLYEIVENVNYENSGNEIYYRWNYYHENDGLSGSNYDDGDGNDV